MEGASSKKLSVLDIAKTDKGLLQSKELYQYILETSVYPRESELLKELRNITYSQPRSLMLCSADEGPVMSLLLKLIHAKKTIEVGVYTGYSLLVTALTIPHDGKIVAIDTDRKMYEVGAPFFKKAGVEHKVEFVESLGIPALDQLLKDANNEGSFDYAFVDADKFNFLEYHERLMRLVRIGGLILFDNTLWSGTVAWTDDSTLDENMKKVRKSMRDVNDFLAVDPRIQLLQLPVGDGLTICMRLH